LIKNYFSIHLKVYRNLSLFTYARTAFFDVLQYFYLNIRCLEGCSLFHRQNQLPDHISNLTTQLWLISILNSIASFTFNTSMFIIFCFKGIYKTFFPVAIKCRIHYYHYLHLGSRPAQSSSSISSMIPDHSLASIHLSFADFIYPSRLCISCFLIQNQLTCWRLFFLMDDLK